MARKVGGWGLDVKGDDVTRFIIHSAGEPHKKIFSWHNTEMRTNMPEVQPVSRNLLFSRGENFLRWRL